jgi:hypothetical protein
MNREQQLFKNKFITQPITTLNNSQIREYRKYYEEQKNNLQKQKIIEQLPSKKTNKFKGTFREAPVNYMNGSNGESNIITFDKINVISIDTSDRDTIAYPNPNNFRWTFEKEYTNVKQIELISTQIPNSDQTIKNTPVELANNIISWINEEDYNLNVYNNITLNIQTNIIEIIIINTFTINTNVDIFIFNSKINFPTNPLGIIDGKYQATVINSNTLRINYTGALSSLGTSSGTCSVDLGYPVYSVELTPGNYNADSLVKQMTTAMNNVKRQNGLGIYHYFNITFSNDTNIIACQSVIQSNNLINNPISTIANSTIITVTQLNHGFHTGDNVFMINVLDTAGISNSLLNGNHIVTIVDFNTFQYQVNIPANATTNGGGNNVQTGTNAPFKFLFETANTLIQYNIGFFNEDSSQYIGEVDPITTKSLSINNAIISTLVTPVSIPIIRFTTTLPHGLFPCTILQIVNISNTYPVVVTTLTPHQIELPQVVTVTKSNSYPNINGDLYAMPTGPYTFEINERDVNIIGTSGLIFYGGDKVQVSQLRTIPTLENVYDFYVLNVVSSNQFDISFNASGIDTSSFMYASINTSQITINQPNHNFNRLNSITGIDTNFTLISTQIPNDFIGSYTNGINITDGPSNTNTVNINLDSHGLITSDEIQIINSNTLPIVDGKYKINIIDVNNFQINFVHTTFTTGTGTIITGDTINITGSNSTPVIDGTYNLNNKTLITGIAGAGTSVFTFTTNYITYWQPGDNITISNVDTNLNGEWTIFSISGLNIVIHTPSIFSTMASSGTIINHNSMQIKTNVGIVSTYLTSVSNDNNITTLTTNILTNWNVNDIVTITDTDPNIDTDIHGNWYITSISGYNITINANTTFTPNLPGPIGLPNNVITNISLPNKIISIPGNTGSLQRNQNVILYRALGDTLNGNNIGGIPITSINNISFPIISIVDKDNYILRITNIYANRSVSAGGSGVYTSNMVSGWRSTQANTTSGSNTDGTLLARAINLAGEYYILLVSPTLNYNSTFKVSSRVDNVLAKINLTQTPGYMNYNEFDTVSCEFFPPLSKLPYMDFQMVTRNGYPFNFKSLNYAFSLRIIEQHKQLKNANENTRTH